MRLKTISMIFGAATLLSSCEEDTSFVLPRGEGIEVSLDQSIYTHITFYSLTQNRIALEVEKEAYDLAIHTAGESTVFLNSSLVYRVMRTDATDITTNIDVEGANWLYDDASGDPANSAFGSWSNNQVFVIGKIVDNNNPDPTVPDATEPYAKIQFVKANNQLEVKVQMIGSTEVKSYLLPTTSQARPFTWLTIQSGPSKIQPPAIDAYDLVFRPYTEKLMAGPGSYVAYGVNGTLTNRAGGGKSYLYPVEAGLTTEAYNAIYDQIGLPDVELGSLNLNANVIGYNWKKTSGDPMSGAVTYVIVPSKMYIISNSRGDVFKMRFNSFYKSNDNSNQSNKGYVSFEYEWLE